KKVPMAIRRAGWMVYVLAAAPGVITNENRDRLTAAAERSDSWWSPRLKAALLFRRGEFQKAADLFDQHGGGPAFEFLAAMAHHQLKRADRARQLFEQGNAWLQQQRDNEPGCGSGVPRAQGWQEWCVLVQLQREAARLLTGARLTDLDARLKKEPGHVETRLARARLLASLGVHDEALEDLSQVAK